MVSSVFHVLKGDYHSSFKLLLYDTKVAELHTLQNIIVNVGTTFGKVGKNVTGLIKI